jgi:hypothetical protein
MTDFNLTVSDYRKIHAEREEQSRKYIIKSAYQRISDHQDHKMVTITNKDTSIIKY